MTKPHYQEIADAMRDAERDISGLGRMAELFEGLEYEPDGDGAWLGWAAVAAAAFWLGMLVWWLA